ncbi:hypothetical protein [Bradyrhizobium sp. cf659]|nr:hypothetical protein [Bradyrhizobium sp. cf659]
MTRDAAVRSNRSWFLGRNTAAKGGACAGIKGIIVEKAERADWHI